MTLVDPVAFDIDEAVAPVRAPPAETRIAGDNADPIPPAAWLARIADDAVGLLAMLGEQRWTDPLANREEVERRVDCVRAALETCGAAAAEATMRLAARGREDGRSWALWPAALVSARAADAWLGRVEALLGPGASVAEVRVVTDAAIASGIGAEVRSLSEALANTDAPGVRAALFELLAGEAAIGAGALEHEASTSTAAAGVASALRALSRKDASGRALGIARARLEHADPDVRFEAARALAIWGAPDAREHLRSPSFCEALGPRAARLVVMCGEAVDLSLLERIAHASGLSPALLGEVARFGHPQAWSLLLHALAEPDLEREALAALQVLFGDIVPVADARVPAAWREAIAALELDDDGRVLRGQPWSLAGAAAELGRADGSAAVMDARLDELRARTGLSLAAPLGAPLPAAIEALALARSEVARLQSRLAPGTWGAVRR